MHMRHCDLDGKLRMSAAKSGGGDPGCRHSASKDARKRAYGSIRATRFRASPRLGREILHIRRRVVVAGRHQLAIGAEEVVLALDLDPRVLFRTNRRAPEWTRLGGPLGLLGDRPRSRQRVVMHGDVDIEGVLVSLVEIEALLD